MKHALCVLLLLPGIALGEPYVFFGVGLSHSTTSHPASSGNEVMTSQGYGLRGERDTTHGGLPTHFGAGYRLNKFVALEGAHYDLGAVHKYTSTLTRISGGAVQSAGAVKEWHARAVELALIGAWPVSSSVSIVGKASAVRLRGHYESELDCDAGCTSRAVRSRGHATSPGFGIGADFRLERHVAVRVMLESWRLKSGSFGPEGEDLSRIDLLSFRAAYLF